MLPRPTTEQFLPPAYGKTADGCKAGLSSCHAALTSYAVTSAQVSGELYGYDNIGNRRLMFGGADYAVYTANELNQYTKVDTNGSDFTPEYDADGNQTLVQTGTGIWKVDYNAQNRAVKFENTADGTIITCAYDYMGRRFEKKVTTNGTVTLHERYLYRNYLQIAALDLLANTTKHTILWDPTQPTATRPLAIQQAGTYYTYAWDLTKNIIALFTPTATLSTTYTYTPFGKVTTEGDITQPIQWSSEYHDPELDLVYYNYRYYNPTDGRWTRRDPIGIKGGVNLYCYIQNGIMLANDILGLATCNENNEGKIISVDGFTFTLTHASRDEDFDITISDAGSTITSYIKNIIKGKFEEVATKIVVKYSSTIANSLRTVVSTYNALGRLKKRAILSTSIGTTYVKASFEVAATRCCCKKQNKKRVYYEKNIKGIGIKGGGPQDLPLIDIRALFISSVIDQKIFNETNSDIATILSDVFTKAALDLKNKKC